MRWWRTTWWPQCPGFFIYALYNTVSNGVDNQIGVHLWPPRYCNVGAKTPPIANRVGVRRCLMRPGPGELIEQLPGLGSTATAGDVRYEANGLWWTVCRGAGPLRSVAAGQPAIQTCACAWVSSCCCADIASGPRMRLANSTG